MAGPKPNSGPLSLDVVRARILYLSDDVESVSPPAASLLRAVADLVDEGLDLLPIPNSREIGHDLFDGEEGEFVVFGRVTRESAGVGGALQVEGVPRANVQAVAMLRAPKTEARRAEMQEIVDRASPWAGDRRKAMLWYQTEPIPALGGRTAESLVEDGQAAAVRDYLDTIAVGGYA